MYIENYLKFNSETVMTVHYSCDKIEMMEDDYLLRFLRNVSSGNGMRGIVEMWKVCILCKYSSERWQTSPIKLDGVSDELYLFTYSVII